jgi:hypothetical protein
MNLNTYLNYTTSQPLTCGGHVAHLQASAIDPAVGTLLLVLQGRATHVRALWAAFHEKALIADGAYFPRAEGKVYLKPNPVVHLPGGIQYWLIHHDLTPKHVDSQPHFYTFGPTLQDHPEPVEGEPGKVGSHFHAMMAAATAVPLLPHWERPVFDWGLKAGLIQPLSNCFNIQVYQVARDLESWMELLARHHKELIYESPT